jgi:hypothetical protein
MRAHAVRAIQAARALGILPDLRRSARAEKREGAADEGHPCIAKDGSGYEA